MANQKNIRVIPKDKMKMFGRDYVKILTRLLLSNKPYAKRATGALINSLDYRLIDDAKQIQIISNKYLQYVDKGRRPGSWVPIRPLKAWASVKGIPQAAVYPIRRNIYKFGIKPTNVVQRTTKEFEKSSTLRKKYEDVGVENIIEMVNKEFKYI